MSKVKRVVLGVMGEVVGEWEGLQDGVELVGLVKGTSLCVGWGVEVGIVLGVGRRVWCVCRVSVGRMWGLQIVWDGGSKEGCRRESSDIHPYIHAYIHTCIHILHT